ncbi:MAG: sterol desaturase family protein [Elusimicrobia bacterium]|nr:sterol desaturase family protein [Elusimicrobiota bacterium]
MSALMALAGGFAFAEFAGYWVHRLLHSNKIEFLSRNHMIHHLVIYQPNGPMRRSSKYLKTTQGRAGVDGIGLEWFIPVGILMAALLTVFRALGTGTLFQIVFIASGLSWGYFMFHYMHDAMHRQNFWMEKKLLLGPWFCAARRLHDIHHMTLNDAGVMDKNYGICFFGVDKIFGTIAPSHRPFNRQGLEAARHRYAYIWKLPEVRAVLESIPAINASSPKLNPGY